MTFKHVQFEDSAIMRSLEKVAQEKGLIKPEPLTKTAAAKKTDLTPTTSLLDNVLKLCSGLRERGFEKQANDLEGHLVNYKVAQTLYETSPEKGEDVIHAAHPKGSHKLEGLDASDDGAVVEDILDQHAKNLQMIEKKPTGKLSTAKAINAVKQVLGQDMPATKSVDQMGIKELISSAFQDLQTVQNIAKQSGGLTGIVLYWVKGRIDLTGKLAMTPLNILSVNDINDAIDAVNAVSRNLHPNALHNYLPDFLNKGISTDALWEKLSQRLDGAKLKLQAAASKLADAQVNPENDVGPVVSKLNDLLSRLQQYAPKVSKYNAGASFVNDESAEIKALIDKLNQEGASPALSAEVASKEKEVNDFATSWQKVLA